MNALKGKFVRFSEERLEFINKKAKELGITASSYLNILVAEKEKENK